MADLQDFAIFILTHGRPNKQDTYNTLVRLGCEQYAYFVLDNEDETVDEYRKKYERILIFDKKKYLDLSDTMDNGGKRGVILPARNACFDLAKQIGVRYFLEFDDDYDNFSFRTVEAGRRIANADIFTGVLRAYLNFLKIDRRVKTIAFSQGGDLIGGSSNNLFKKPKRKAMNSFFCDAENPFLFKGRINEDVNTYSQNGQKGDIFLTPYFVQLHQEQTQQNAGGMTEIYLDGGTYIKSFYSVIGCPSGVKISCMGNKYKRIHHKVLGAKLYPLILSDRYKK